VSVKTHRVAPAEWRDGDKPVYRLERACGACAYVLGTASHHEYRLLCKRCVKVEERLGIPGTRFPVYYNVCCADTEQEAVARRVALELMA